MCNAANCEHYLDDDLGDIFASAPVKRALTDDAAKAILAAGSQGHETSRFPKKTMAGPKVFIEDCKACNGSGRFYSYTGRLVGNCFKCEGRGKVEYKTSPESRDAGKAARDAKKAEEGRLLMEQVAQWAIDNPIEFAWINAATARGFDFAGSMLTALAKYGRLTDNQLAAVRRLVIKDEERDAARKAAIADAPQIDAAALAKIHASFAKARENLIQRPKMRLDTFLFSLAVGGKNDGAIYVKHLEETDYEGQKRYMGKIVGDQFFGFKCSPEETARIVAAASDPENAAIAYGQRVGKCSICGLKLTKEESIQRTIGPICFGKYFG